MIAEQAKGFLYCVSSLGVTGVRSQITTDIHAMVEQVKQVSDIPPVPLALVFPHHSRHMEMAAKADGAIVGSAIVKLVARYGKDCIAPVCEYIKEMKAAVSRAEN